MKKTARMELKVTPEFKKRVVKYSQEQKRSVNNTVEVLVSEKLDEIDKVNPLK